MKPYSLTRSNSDSNHPHVFMSLDPLGSQDDFLPLRVPLEKFLRASVSLKCQENEEACFFLQNVSQFYHTAEELSICASNCKTFVRTSKQALT